MDRRSGRFFNSPSHVVRAVSTLVNRPGNDDPACIAPAVEEPAVSGRSPAPETAQPERVDPQGRLPF